MAAGAVLVQRCRLRRTLGLEVGIRLAGAQRRPLEEGTISSRTAASPVTTT